MQEKGFPKYQILKDELRRLALSEEEGYRIPAITALIDKYGVSSTTVLRAIKDLTTEGYLTTIQGSGTFVSKPLEKEVAVGNRNIGLIITDMVETTHPVLAKVIRAVSLTAKKYGYNIVFVVEQNNNLFGPHSAMLEEDLRSGYYAGLLLVSPLRVEDLGRLFTFNVPFVNISNEYPDERIYSVSTDHYYDAYLAMQYCARRGCKNILYISGPATMNGYRMVLSAYRTCTLEYELEMRKENFQTTDYDENQAYDIVINRYADNASRPDAIVAHDGVLARGAYHALERLGLSVPEDVILVQSGEIFTNPAMRKVVSYIDLHHEEMCSKAADKVIKLIRGQQVAERVEYVYPTLMECPAIKIESKAAT